MATGQVRPRKAGNPDCPLGLVKTSDPTTGIRSEGWALEGWALGPPQEAVLKPEDQFVRKRHL